MRAAASSSKALSATRALFRLPARAFSSACATASSDQAIDQGYRTARKRPSPEGMVSATISGAEVESHATKPTPVWELST